MKYLYGDGTESNLSSNYLEYLKAVLEFSFSVLKGELNIARDITLDLLKRTEKHKYFQRIAAYTFLNLADCVVSLCRDLQRS